MELSDLLSKPADTDILWQWIKILMPEGNNTAFGGAFGLFTSAIMLVGVGMVAYFTISGIVSSAYQGKVLGDKYHQIWAPLRVVVGFGMLVPLSGGFSSVHYLLRDMAAPIAINLGNAPAVFFTERVVGDGEAITPYRVGGNRLILDIMKHEACLAYTNKDGSYFQTSAPSPTGSESGWGIVSDKNTKWDYGSKCGYFTYSLRSDRPEFSDARREAIGEIIDTVRPLAEQYAAYFKRHPSSRTVGELQDIARSKTCPTGSAEQAGELCLPFDIFTTINNAGTAFDSKIVAAALAETKQIASGSRAKIVEATKAEGLMNLGGNAITLSQISALTSELTNEEPKNTPPRFEDLKRIPAGLRELLDGIETAIAGDAQFHGASANDLAAAADESSGIITKVIAPLTRGMFESITTGERVDNAMSHITSTGHVLMTVAASTFAIGIAAMVAASNAAGSFFGAEGGISYVLDWGTWGIGLTYILGALRGYVFAIIPFILMYIAGMKWMLYFVQALIASVLWAFAFIRMDGSEAVDQKQAAGLVLLFNLILSPVLTVLAMLSAFALFDMMYSYINMKLSTAFFGAQGGTIPGLGALIVYYIIDTFLAWTLAINLFGYIASIKDDVMSWMGEKVASDNSSSDVIAAVGGAKALVDKAPTKKMEKMAKAVTRMPQKPTVGE